jgi:hypothetical protein
MSASVTPTEDQVKSYVEQRGMRCPACGGPMVSTNSPPDDSESHELIQDVECLSCAATWQDVYVLTTIRNLKLFNRIAEAQ